MNWRTYPYTAQWRRPHSMEYSHRPLLNILISGKESGNFMALVDSGTDVTMMDSEIAVVLGIDSKGCQTGIASGVGGQKKGFLSKVKIQVPEFKKVITTTVLFVNDLSFPAILGQDDFFRNFHVCFDRSAKEFRLKLSK